MNLYRQSIILFGMVVPVIFVIAIIGGGFLIKSNMTASYENKQASYKSYEQGRLESMQIENKVTRQRQHLDRWTEAFKQETASLVSNNLREILAHLPNKEIQQTSFERMSGTGGFGSVSAQKSSQVRLALRGTFRTLQRALLELETRMPQLQLLELRIDPSTNQSSQLNFQATYTAWES